MHWKPIQTWILLFATTAASLLFAGCGQITDKDRIVIAELDGEPIRRGDLRRLIRDMDDDERPIIRNKGDLLRVLNKHIDDTLLDTIVARLRGEKVISVDREQAREIYFGRNPDDRRIYALESEEDLEKSELGISVGQLNAFKADMEFDIDHVEDSLYRQAALNHVTAEALEEGAIEVTEEELRNEYQYMKDRLFYFERIGFVGVRFPTSLPEAARAAASVRQRYDDGMSFEDIVEYYHDLDPKLVVQSMIENNPSLDRFQSFWQKASGKQEGEVVGPVYMAAYSQAERKPDGSVEVVEHPASYVVFQVVESVPMRQKTFEEAQQEIVPVVARRKMMRKLREDHGVKVIEENLPDPARYGAPKEGEFIDVP